MESYPSSDFVSQGLPPLIFVRELPVPLFREWRSYPSSDFVRELPIPSSSLESSPSLLFVNGVSTPLGLR
ncbi:Hypothetical protein FKW44_021899 [Caligus rogercresseyi]|uniref:Uncharacterized protein n=1 Tax=Caligus rogercresseyi TaxID=217165 RepID=A0A7T8GS45_CALRO|nr:Hypothetical protein FKW44_021899 [Caligus rogercresseyi]